MLDHRHLVSDSVPPSISPQATPRTFLRPSKRSEYLNKMAVTIASSSFVGARVTSRPKVAARTSTRGALTVRAAKIEESALMAKYPDGGPVFAVSIDCHMGTNSTGLVMKEGDEGRPVVTMIRPGGTAKNKVKVGDVCLACSFTELINDPTNKTMKWGTPQTGWFDTEGESYAAAICAMETNSTSLDMIMFRPE